jgi:hypothetical protein
MYSGKLAIVVLLLCAITLPNLVTSTCTKEQKEEILKECHSYIRKDESDVIVVPRNGRCCDAVRKVHHSNIECVYVILTPHEKEGCNVHRLLTLEYICKPESPSLPRPNMNQVKSLTPDLFHSTLHASPGKLK